MGFVAARAVYLGVGPLTAFGLYQPALAGSTGSAVVICPPWGWDEIASYRARRQWAEELAAAGHPVLRFDLPGTGDSGGVPADRGLVAAWIGAVHDAASWLGSETGRPVAAIGLGIGGLIAFAAIDAGAPITDLVLWSTPGSGATFLRGQRAFAGLQTAREEPPASTVGGSDGGLPDGWLEIGGFVLSAETIDDLGNLRIADLGRGSLRRVLALGRDGLVVDRAVRARLDELDLESVIQDGPGWEAMCFHPERYSVPLATWHQVEKWLGDGSATSPRGDDVAMDGRLAASRPVGAADDLLLEIGDRRIREQPTWLDGASGRLFGIVAEPADRAPSIVGRIGNDRVVALFLNAGAVRRIGPNRLWTTAARRWAARGVPSIRLDLGGIGDSDGDAARFVDVGEFYTTAQGAAVDGAIQALTARYDADRVVLVGLCAGAYWAFHAAASDDRVEASILLNPRALVWDVDLETRREAGRITAVFSRSWWLRVIRGEVGRRRLRSVATAVLARLRVAVRDRLVSARRQHPDAAAGIAATVDRIAGHGGRIVLAFSGEEPLHDELVRDGVMAMLRDRSHVRLVDLPGRDHTVRPVVAQAAVDRLLDHELDRWLGPGARIEGAAASSPGGAR
jgi:alpha-beta hydrolase superfamily lysophospholipase